MSDKLRIARQLYIFRHGETDWNREERFQGHLDVPLNSTGREQARKLIAPLKNLGIQAVLSSDLSRAFETGQIIADALGLPTFRDQRLREANLGEAQGLVRTEIEARFGTELALRWKSSKLSDADIAYPGGETGSQINLRVLAALTEFCSLHNYQKIGVATHGGVIRRIVHLLWENGDPWIPIPNGILYGLEMEPTSKRWRFLPQLHWADFSK